MILIKELSFSVDERKEERDFNRRIFNRHHGGRLMKLTKQSRNVEHCFKKGRSIGLVVLLCLIASCSNTNQKYGAAATEVIVNEDKNILGTGYAVISIQQHSNPAQQRLLSIRASKLDAYRALMEQVYGQYLDANTTVAEMVVESDAFRARVHGVVYGAKLVSIKPIGDDTYETTLSLSNSTVRDLRNLYLDQLASTQGS